jgi:lysozyme
MNIEAIKADIARDEGKRNLMYLDSVGIPTIGIGHNLERPISDRAVSIILEDDLADVIEEMNGQIPWWQSAPEPVQRGLVNMAFNLGLPRLLKFSKMLTALECGEYDMAADEAMASKWAAQTGERAERIATIFRSA